MSSSKSHGVEIITDGPEAVKRIGSVKSESVALSPPLYMPEDEGNKAVIVGVDARQPAPLALELSEEDYLLWLERLIKTEAPRLIVHDLKSWLKPVYERMDAGALAGFDFGRFDCAYLLAYLMDPPERIEGEIEGDRETSLLLENPALKYLDVRYPRLETWLVDRDPATAIHERLWEDARLIRHVWEAMTRRLHAEGQDGADLLRLYREAELPLVGALLDLELRGIRVDRERAVRVLKPTQASLETLLGKIRSLGDSFADLNAMDDSQVSRTRARPREPDREGVAEDEESPDVGASGSPAANYVSRYRRLTGKAAFLKAAASSDGHVRASYYQCSVSTGRLAVRNPPLQALSRNTRKLYLLPDEGHVLMEADYSQAEARLMAVLSRDPVLCAVFAESGGERVEFERLKDLGALYYLWKQNSDFHAITAEWLSLILGRTVTRDDSKTVMYAVSYGMSPQSLAEKLGVSLEMGRTVIDGFFALYPRVGEWKQEVVEELTRLGKKNGIAGRYLRTPRGRRRMFDRSLRDDPGEARRAVNFLLQGQVADLIKQAQVDLYRALVRREMNSRIVLQLHDALYLSVAPDELSEVEQMVGRAMEELFPIPDTPYTIRMVAEVKIT